MASEEKLHNGSLIPKSPVTQNIDKELIELEKELGQVEEKILAALGIEMEEFMREKMFTKLSKKSDRRPDPLKDDKKREKKRLKLTLMIASKAMVLDQKTLNQNRMLQKMFPKNEFVGKIKNFYI